MRKSSLVSKVAITSLAAFALSAVAQNTLTAADLLWDWSGTQTWDAGTTPAWRDMQTDASQLFADGDNVSFLSGGGTKTINVSGTVYTGHVSIQAESTDDYAYTGKVWFNAGSSIYLDGGTVKFQDIGKGEGAANDSLDIRLNLLGSGTVVFAGSTSSFGGSGSIFVDRNIILEAGDKNTPLEAGGIGKSTVYNYGTIKFYRDGDYEISNQVGGDGVIEKWRTGLMSVTALNAFTNNTLRIMEGAVQPNNDSWRFDGNNAEWGVKLEMAAGTYFNTNGYISIFNSLKTVGAVTPGSVIVQQGSSTRTNAEWFCVIRGGDFRDIKFRDNGAGGVYNAAADSAPGEFGALGNGGGPNGGMRLWFGRDADNVDTFYLGNVENTYTAQTRIGGKKTVVIDGTALNHVLGYGQIEFISRSSLIINTPNLTLNNIEYILHDNTSMIIRGANFTIGKAYSGSVAEGNVAFDRTPIFFVEGGAGIYAYEDVTLDAEINIRDNNHSMFAADGKTMTFTGYMHNEQNHWDPIRKKGAGTVVITGKTELLYIVEQGNITIGSTADFIAGRLLDGSANNRNIRIAEGASMDISAWNTASGTALNFEGSDTDLGKGHWRNIENKGTFIGDILLTGTGGVVVGNYRSDNIIRMAKLVGNLTVQGGQSSNIGLIDGDLTVSAGVINGDIGSVTGDFIYSGGTMAGVGSVGGSVTATGGSIGHIAKVGTDLSLTGTTWSIDRAKGPVSVLGNLDMDAASIIKLTPGARNGDTLITVGGTATVASGIVVEGLLARQTGATVVDNAGNIQLSITTDVKSLAWDWANTAGTGGVYSNVWDNTLKTWTGGTLMFVDEDIVSFTSPAGAKTIMVSAGTVDDGVRPGGMDVTTVAGDTLKFGGNRITLLGDLNVTGAGNVILKNLGFSANASLNVNGTGSLLFKVPPSAVEGTVVNALHKVSLDGGATLESITPILADLYDLGNATVKASLLGSTTKAVTANIHGNTVLAAENALSGTMLVNLNSGSLTSNVKNGFSGINVLMADNTTIRLNGTNNMLQQVRAVNGASAVNAIVENGSATDAQLAIVYQISGDDNVLDLSGVKFRDGGTGKLSLSMNSFTAGNTKLYFNTKNEYTGGTYFNGWDCAVYFGHAEAFGTGPMYLHNHNTYATANMVLANDIHTADRTTVGMETDYEPVLWLDNGKSLTLTGDLVVSEGTYLRFRNTRDSKEGEITLAFQPSAPYASIDGWVDLASGTRVNISTSGAAGTTDPADLPPIRLSGWVRFYFDDTMALPTLFRSQENDSSFLVPKGKTLSLTGYFEPRATRLEAPRFDGDRWINFGLGLDESIDQGTIIFAGTGLSNPAYGLGPIYQATNTRFTVWRGATLQLGNNDRTGYVNSVWGHGDSDVTWFNLLQDGKLIVNWSGDYLMNFVVEHGDKNKGTFVKKGSGLATIARQFRTYGDVIIEEGGINFAASKKYSTQFKQSSWDAMNYYASIQIGTGTTAILDYITAGGTAEHTTNTLISGAGDLVIGTFLDPYDAAFVSTYVLSNTDYTGSTTVNANNVLKITSSIFNSKDIVVNEAGTLTLNALDLTFDSFRNKGAFTGGRIEMNGGTFANTGTVNAAVYVQNAAIDGLGAVTGVVKLTGNTVLVNARQAGPVAVTGNTTLDGNTLIFRAGDLLDITGSLTAGTNNTVQVIAGKDGLQAGSYTLIKYSDIATPVTSGFVADANARAGLLTVDTSTAGQVNLVVGTASDRTWNGSAGTAWTIGAGTNWDEGDQLFYNLDNVTFGTTGAGTVAVAAGGVMAGNITISADGYTFTGGSIAGALDVTAGTVSFQNAGLNLSNITVASGATIALDLANDGILVSHLDGAGTVEKLGTNLLKWYVTDTDGAVTPTATYTGVIKVTDGTLDLINTTTAAIELNGGTLTSTSMAKVGSAVKLTADSTIDLAGAAFASASYQKWVNEIDTNGKKLILRNGALDNTLGAVISATSNLDAAASVYDESKLGKPLMVTDVTLENGSINRALRPVDGNSVLRIQGDRMNSLLSTYATIDLSNGGKLTVDVVGEANPWARNFLIGDGEFVKKGTGTFSFVPINLDDYYVKGSNDFQYVGMTFSGTFTVDEGTLEFKRTADADNWAQRQPFAGNYLNPTQAKIVVNSGAYLATLYHGNLGSYKGGIPDVTINEGGTFLVAWDTFIQNLTLYGDAKVVERLRSGYASSLRAMRLANLDGTENDPLLDSSSAHLIVHGGTGATASSPSTATISTERLTMSEGNWHITVDPEAVLKVIAQIEVGNDSVRTLKIDGGGKVIFAENPTSDMSQTTVSVLDGSTLVVGYDDLINDTGGFGNAKIKNEGNVIYDRVRDYDLNVTMSGTGNLVKNRFGQMNVTKTNTFTGLLTINEGSVRLSASNSGAFASDILVKKDALFNLTSYASGYGIGAKDGLTTKQYVVIEDGGSMTGTALLNNGATLYNAGSTATVVINSGGRAGGLTFGNSARTGIVTVNSGGTFIAGSMADPINGGAYTPVAGESSLVKGSLNVNGGGVIRLDVDNSSNTSDKIVYTGALTLTADATNKIKLDLNNLNTASTTGVNGTYVIFEGDNHYTAAQFVSMAQWFKYNRAVFDFTTSTDEQIIMTISGSESLNLTWGGAANGVWKDNDESNLVWKRTGALTDPSTYFVAYDTVTFDNLVTGSGNTVVVTGAVTPKQMTVTGKDYTFSGTGAITTDATGTGVSIDGVKASFNNANNSFSAVVLANNGTLNLGENQTAANYIISGAGNLEKSGTTTLDLSTRTAALANTYTGTTTVSGGTLKIAALDNISSADITLNGGTLQVADALDLTNAGVRSVNIGSAGGSINVDATFTAQAKLGTLGGGFTKLGAGVLEIQDNATFAKAITINEGTLKTTSSKFASLNGTAGTLDANNSVVRVQSGNFGGSFSNMTKLHVGNVDFGTSSETFTYTGGDITASTTIEDGSTLVANVDLGSGTQLVAGSTADITTAIRGNLTLGIGSELYIAESDTGSISSGNVGTLKVEGNVSLSGTNMHASASFGHSVDQIAATGKLTLDATNASDITFESDGAWGTGEYTLATFSTFDLQGGSDVKDAFIVKGLTRKELVYTVNATSLTFSVTGQSATWIWDNGSTNGRWDLYDAGTDASDNWDDNGGFYTPNSFAAGDNAIFTDNAAGTINVWGPVTGSGNAAVNVNNVTFQNTTGSYTFTGGNIIANKISTTGNGSITFNNVVTAEQILVDGGAHVTFNAANNKANEQMYITNGTVTLGVNDALSNTAVKIDGSTGKLIVASGTSNTVSKLTGTTGTVDLTGATLKVESGSYSGQMVGNSSSVLEKTGTGMLSLSGLSSGFAGTLAVTSGGLTLNGANEVTTFNTSAGTSIVLGGNLAVSNGSNDGNISGTGNLTTKGTYTLGGTNSFVGNLIVESGTTTLNSAGALSASSGINVKSSATLDLNGNSISAASLSAESNATVNLNNANLTSGSTADSQFEGNLIGNGSLIKDGTGKLTLTGNNSFSGGLDVRKGSVEVNTANSLGTGNITLNDNSQLILNGSISVSNNLSVNGKGTVNSVSGTSSSLSSVALAGNSSSFVKAGDGELILNNGITLNGGKLFVNGGTLTSTANDIIIGDGEVLGGSGKVQGNVIVQSGGKVSPGNSIGKLTITGNQTFLTGSLLDIEVSSVADASLSGIWTSDRLTVGGLLSVDMVTINVLKEGNSSSFVEDTYKFLIMEAGSVALNINNLILSSNDPLFTDDYKTTFVQEGNNIYMLMNINRPEYYQYVDGENQGNVAAYLDGGWDNSSLFWKKTVPSAVRANPGQASEFLDQLSGYSLAHATQSRELAGEHFRQLWSQRLNAGQAARPSLDSATVNINPTEAMSMAKFKDVESEMKESYWAQPFTYDMSMASENHVKGYDYRASGVTAGFDTRFDTGMVIGAAFFYEDGKVDTKRSSDKTSIDDTRFAVYGGWDEEDVSLIASASYGIQQYDSKRYVNIGDLGGRNKADYDGNTYGVSIDGAVRITKQMRVFAGFDWLNVSRDSFHEKGSDFAMDVSKETHDMLASRLGVRYDRYFGNFGVYGLVAWRHRFDDTASDLKGSYDGTPGSFKSNGLSNDADSALLGLGGEYNITPNYSIFADANADLNTDHSELGLSAGVRYTW